MESDAHCFSDSDTEYDGLRSNSLNDEETGDAECAWAHPYESMELIKPPAKLLLRDFPVVDLAREAEAAGKREGKLNALLAFSQDGDSSGAGGVTHKLGKGSWTIRVGQSGGVGRVIHEEIPGADQKTIVPCVGKEGTGQVLVGSLGGSGWDFAEVARTDKRSTSLLWPKDKCSSALKGTAKAGVARLPTDIAEMTPEERLQRERRDEKNRKERERRAQLKLDKLAKKEEELAQAAAAAAVAVQPHSFPPGGPNVSSAPTTPAPSTPPESSEAGTPQNVKVVRHDFMKVEAKAVEVTPAPSHHLVAAPGAKTVASARQPIPEPPIALGAAPRLPSSIQGTPVAPVAVQSTAASVPTQASAARAQEPPVVAATPKVSSSSPTPLPATQKPAEAAASLPVSAAPPPAPNQISAAPAEASPAQESARQMKGEPTLSPSSSMAVAPAEPAKVASVPAQSCQAPVLPSAPQQNVYATTSAMLPAPPKAAVVAVAAVAAAEAAEPTSSPAHKDGDDTMKENVEDEEMKSSERGRCQKVVEELNGKQSLSKRRRLASLSPVEVNLRASDAHTKRAVRPRGVQRA